ncbi:MAG: TRAP transporter small permease [Verrucomicrobia bacterium]|nr:TRAP transporter small permease [Verrucomicrobiota bacterium]
MGKIVAFEKWLTRILEWILAATFFGFFLLIIILVILRYVFNTTIIGTNEGIVIAFIFTTAIGGAVAISRREHIATTFFVDKLPDHIRTGIDILGLAMVALINAVMVWQSIYWIGRTGGFMMPAMQMPQWVAQISIPIGCSLAIVYCLLKIAILASGKATRALQPMAESQKEI